MSVQCVGKMWRAPYLPTVSWERNSPVPRGAIITIFL